MKITCITNPTSDTICGERGVDKGKSHETLGWAVIQYYKMMQFD